MDRKQRLAVADSIYLDRLKQLFADYKNNEPDARREIGYALIVDCVRASMQRCVICHYLEKHNARPNGR